MFTTKNNIYLTKIATLLVIMNIVDAEVFTIGYITGSKRRLNDFEYQRPGYRISGAINLAVEEINSGELGRRGHKIEFIVAETYGEEEISILMTAQLWTKNISVYIGPQETCIHEARMAAAFNIPMISYFCTYHETSNKIEFPTFARTRPPDTQISKSVISVLLAFNWTKVTFMYMNSSLFEFNNKMSSIATTILNSFESSGITINSLRCWQEPYYASYMKNPFHDFVSTTYRETRIYVILGNYYEHMGLLIALNDKKLLQTGDYWVVGVDVEQYDEQEPDKYLRGLWQKETNVSLIDAFNYYFSIVASAPINFNNFTKIINEYRQKPPFNFTNPLANVGGIVQIVPETAYLYDAVHLYEKSLLKVLDNNQDPRDGRSIIKTLYGMHYHSAMGYMVYMDENGDAEGNYTLIALNNHSIKGHGLYPIGFFIGKDKSTNLPKLKLTKQINWPKDDIPPLAEPFCGYHGEKCNSHIGEIFGGIVGGLSLIIISVLLIIYRNWKYEQELDSLLWKVNYKDIQIKDTKDQQDINNDIGQKNYIKPIMRTSQVSLSSNPDSDFRYSMIYTEIGIYKGRIFAIKRIKKKSIEITREMKKELKIMKDLRHDNLNAFIGACTDPPNICIVIEYCTRGSLKDIIENEDIKLDNMFMASLVGDIIRGMMYLHESILKYHGNLKTSNCLVDSRWVVKLADFGLKEFKKDAESYSDDLIQQCQGLLYKAPEILRCTNLIDEMSIRYYQKADVYSFAIVLYELYGRHGPFGVSELSPPEILEKIANKKPHTIPYRPPLNQLENCFDFVRECLIECWAEDPEIRPDFKIIRNKLRPMRKGMKPNIFDNMMAIMEKYANNLEALVDERTDQLIEEKKKTDALLYEMLPKSVAEQLKRGKKVEAESFDCVTIYFSDIVGFTAMSAESTPLQVVNFLNDLYTCFDSTIETFDVYKVETIGDAYMVVSGLPIKNGIEHAGEIASMSLCLLNSIKRFSIRHKPLDKLQLRIGIHSGPVCAGVVGSKMPRYCLFGDTVNTASRMESTGAPLKIHCSMETKNLLDELGGFYLVERGVVSMKGKGERLTYWLIGENSALTEIRTEKRLIRRNNIEINDNNNQNILMPKSSLKNKSLNKTTFFRCSSESPKRLRFSSSDQLNQKSIINPNQPEYIIDDDLSNFNTVCLSKNNYLDNLKSSSNSCPCVEKLHLTLSDNSDKYSDKNKTFPFLTNEIFQGACKSAPNSPKHSYTILNFQKREAQSNEQLDGYNISTPSTPLIRSVTCNY